MSIFRKSVCRSHYKRMKTNTCAHTHTHTHTLVFRFSFLSSSSSSSFSFSSSFLDGRPTGVAAGDLFQLVHGPFLGVNDHATLAAAERHVDHGALPGHQRGQGAHFVLVDHGCKANTALAAERAKDEQDDDEEEEKEEEEEDDDDEEEEERSRGDKSEQEDKEK